MMCSGDCSDDGPNTLSLQTILQVLKETKARKIYLMGDDPATLLKTFKSYTHLSTALVKD